MPVIKKGKLHWTGSHSMTCEIWPQGRCEPVFPNIWTFTRKQDKKWPLNQHSYWVHQRQYSLNLLHQDSWWLGCWSQISTRKMSRKGTFRHCPHQEKCWPPSCPVGSSFWGDYLCYCKIHKYPSHQYLQSLQRLHPGKSQKGQSMQKGCTSLKIFLGKGYSLISVLLNSYSKR